MISYLQEYHSDTNHKYYLLIISLIIHGLLIIWFLKMQIEKEQDFSTYFEKSETVQDTDNQQSQSQYSQNKEVAKLIAQSSNFGAPVSFAQDWELPENAAKKEMQQEDQREQEPEKKVEASSENAEEIQEDQAVVESYINPEPIKKPNTPKKIESSSLNQKTVPKKFRAPVKRQISFADFAAGFLQTIAQNRTGNALINRIGNSQVAPTQEDLKYSSYLAKFQWYLENSSRLSPFMPDPAITQDLILQIIINLDKEGNLKQVQIAQSSGRQDIDHHIKKVVTNAAPFPPLPNHFGTDYLTFPMTISIGKSNPHIKNAEYIFMSR